MSKWRGLSDKEKAVILIVSALVIYYTSKILFMAQTGLSSGYPTGLVIMILAWYSGKAWQRHEDQEVAK